MFTSIVTPLTIRLNGVRIAIDLPIRITLTAYYEQNGATFTLPITFIEFNIRITWKDGNMTWWLGEVT